MKKLIALALALVCIVAVFNASNIRIAKGEVSSRTYIEECDDMNTWLTTTDGEVWIAEGYTAPIGDKVFIIYDMCDKSTLYDDEIIYIVHLTKF